jgi:two-component system KDP operon response regulator KdpE
VPDSRLNQGCILVVDDEPQIRRVLRAVLATAGYEVAAAQTGAAALKMIHAGKYDLVLLDVNMPGMDGLETCWMIRSSVDIPVIMLTVRNGETEKIQALNVGADDYVTKPFSANELLARIRAVLRRTPLCRDASSSVVAFEGIEISFVTRRLTVRGADVRLTPKEFDLLHYLVVNSNMPLSHEKILQAVWGPDYDAEVGHLRVLVKQLRKKIEPDPVAPRYILTEPYFGYRFRLPESIEAAQCPVVSQLDSRPLSTT